METKKKITSFLGVILTVFCFCLIFSKPVQAAEFLSFGTGSPAGTYYFLGAGFSKIINENVEGVRVTPESTAASTENSRLMMRGHMHMGLACMGTLRDLKDAGEDVDKIRLIAVGHTSDIHWMVRKKSQIQKVADFEGKTVAVGPAGSATLNIVGKKHLKEGWGLDFDKFDEKFLSFDEVTTGIRNNTLDAGLIFAGYPLSSVMRLARDVDIRLLDIEPEKVEILRDKFGNVVPLTIPGGTYAGIDEDVETYCVPQMWLCRADLSEDLVYNIMKAVYENPEDKNAIHPMAKKYTIENAFRGADNVPVGFHPGAVKFYKEKGIWDKREDYYQ
ncbi:MAG: TAXI family TRAP transporter solute-binding subunit [Gillisia sp.]